MRLIIATLLVLGVGVQEVQAQDWVEPMTLSFYPAVQESSRAGGQSAANDSDWHGTIRLFLGAKDLDQDDWEPVDEQGEFAFLCDFAPGDWAVRLVLDFRFAASDEEDVLGLPVTSFSWEVNFGVRKVFDTGSIVSPYMGVGLAAGGASLEVDDNEDSDGGIGLWFDVGVDIAVVGPVSLGLELSFSTIPIEISGVDTDAGGLRFGFTLGFSW